MIKRIKCKSLRRQGDRADSLSRSFERHRFPQAPLGVCSAKAQARQGSLEGVEGGDGFGMGIMSLLCVRRVLPEQNESRGLSFPFSLRVPAVCFSGGTPAALSGSSCDLS